MLWSTRSFLTARTGINLTVDSMPWRRMEGVDVRYVISHHVDVFVQERPRSILDGEYDGILRYPRRPGSCLARYPTHSHYLSYSTEFLAGPCPAHPDLPPPPPPPPMPHHHEAPPPHRTKHVSFARSHTLTSFDDAVSGKPMVVARSQERLIGKKSMGDLQQQQQGGSTLGESPKVVIMGEWT